MEKGTVAKNVCLNMNDYYNKYYEGIFWIPENEKCKIIATLYIDKKGKATISSLQPLFNKELSNNKDKISVIFGVINSNDVPKTYSIKLYNAKNNFESWGGLSKYQYTSKKVLITDSIDKNICDDTYNSVMFNSQILSDWINITGFKDIDVFTEKFSVNQVYEQPERIDLFKDDNYYIYIFFRATAGYPLKRKTYIAEEVYINIKIINSASFDELIHLQKFIERLFNFLLFYAFNAEHIDIRSKSNKVYKWLFKPEEFVFFPINKLEFEIFRSQSQKIFTNWFNKQDKLNLIIKNFFSVYGQKGVLVENKFLTYVSILENYHRNNFSIEETKIILKKHNKAKLRKYKNKETANFQQRLICMFDNSYIVNKIDNLVKYTEILTNTRDYHIHLLDSKKEKSLTGIEIYRANIILEFVIREFILREMEVSDVNPKLDYIPEIKVKELKLNKT